MTDFWRVLAIAPTNDVRQIKRAYAAKLKQVRPEDDPIAFQRLRDAYEWALEHRINWIAETGEAAEHPARARTCDPVPSADEAYFTQHVVSFVPSYGRTVTALADSNAQLVCKMPLEPSVKRDSRAAWELTPQALPVAVEFLPKLRSVAEFFDALFDFAEQEMVPEQVLRWILDQPEWDSLVHRPAIEAAFEPAFEQARWPWAAVLAVTNLLRWEAPGSNHRKLRAVRFARLQQQLGSSKKPRWKIPLSKSCTAYALMRPPPRFWHLIRPILPLSAWVDLLFTEVEAAGFAADEIFDVHHVTSERARRSERLNPINLQQLVIQYSVYLLCSAAGLGFFFGIDGLRVAVITSTLVFLASLNSKFQRAYWRALWTRSINRPKLRWGVVLPPPLLGMPVLTGIAICILRIDRPLLSLVMAFGLVYYVRASVILAVLCATFCTLLVGYICMQFQLVYGYLNGGSVFAMGMFSMAVLHWYSAYRKGVMQSIWREPEFIITSELNQPLPAWIGWLVLVATGVVASFFWLAFSD